MQPINIFRAGKHRDAHGRDVEFTEDDVKAIAEAYDASKFKAPIVAGHPKDNDPAFGWIERLEYRDGGLYAHPIEVNEDFAEAVKSGAFRNVSASFYLKGSASSPDPESTYLRHVGFLGATPPAIKGLEPIQFNDDDADKVVEFMDKWGESTVARLFRGLREWIVESAGVDAADKVIPSYAVEDLEAMARDPEPDPEPAFNEPANEGDTMTPEQIAQAKADLDAREASFSEREARLKQLEADAAAKAAAADLTDCASFAEDLASKGKLLPGMVDKVAAALHALPADAEALSFSEGDTTVEQTPREALKAALSGLPKLVEFAEHDDGAGSEPKAASSVEFAEQIKAEVKSHFETTGQTLSHAQAASRIRARSAK